LVGGAPKSLAPARPLAWEDEMAHYIDIDGLRRELADLIEQTLGLDLPLSARHRLANTLDDWLVQLVDEIDEAPL
jgi:hypothetical protein